MKRFILFFMVLMLLYGVAYAEDEVMLASISSKQNLLGVDPKMGTTTSTSGGGGVGDNLLLESGDGLLLESGDFFNLE